MRSRKKTGFEDREGAFKALLWEAFTAEQRDELSQTLLSNEQEEAESGIFTSMRKRCRKWIGKEAETGGVG